ncbi:DNA repair protein RecN, partial [Candidatus Desantisbacteria bacterium CG02_land_8_20_14_3_00_49_13]
FADVHFKVEKVVEKGRTKTSVRKLDDNEKVEEIARMISGEKITSTSLKHAQELLRK